jgi:NADPH:quinone reductase-like Zn-dependent oxidoreductase
VKAYLYDKKAKPSPLVLSEVDAPRPAGGQVLVEIRAASVNAAEWRSMQLGIVPKSRIYGADISGAVAEVGLGVKTLKVGDEVVGDLSGSGSGAFAEYAAVPESALTRKPASLSHETCAAFPMAAVTALQALRDAGGVGPGMRVLVNGASGGVGSFAVQLAKHWGAEVVGVCGPGNAERVKARGADAVIDYRSEGLDSRGGAYDRILAVHGDQPLSRYKRLLAPGGRCVIVGGSLSQVFRGIFFGPLLSLGSRKLKTLTARPSPADLSFVLGLAAEGKIAADIEKVWDFTELPAALDYVRSGHARGKQVIRIR